ncbi:uncharacterized protein LOC130304158 isoform X2 [Hyla sarda]|uniref:uncharacterized protein LOC130304158 isoform X2 n=1 Tax=Hyla sarda TaxID=327740 RepID=UPI0024C26D46|nr:uncharacterized protein LOC130304158 isoform X2 [Hyla sarda]
MSAQHCYFYQMAKVVFALGIITTLIMDSQTQNPNSEKKDEKSSKVDDICPVFQLIPNKSTSHESSCKRAQFLPGSCKLMKTIFKEEPANCSHQPTYIICKLSNPKKTYVMCHHDICKKLSDVSVGLYISKMGKYVWHKLKSTQELEVFINSKLLEDYPLQEPHNGFCVIQCTNTAGLYVSQLLILPPILHTRRQQKNMHSNRSLLNINILLLDSVSRHHFYRSLPRTIEEFRHLNKEYFTSGHVYDYELIQGIRSRTLESLQALFGGGKNVLPLVDALKEIHRIVDIHETLGKFKGFGYETLYVEDLCWEYEWGLVKEQGALNLSAPYQERVKLFNEAIHRAGIDRIDVTYSSCLILRANRVKNQFHGSASICYNGIHQHTYLIQYMEYFISRFSSLHKPTFTFMILDTGHEDTGIRIKQLDKDLAAHVSFLAHQENTISFILSDHGNTYGEFLSASPEFHVEMFHPFLFVIVPDSTFTILGEAKMKALQVNQKRLISLLDVHYTFLGLLPSLEYPVNGDGLLSPVSLSRTCKDIPRLYPNICICQGSYRMEANSSYYALFAEFALGYMNKRIIEQRSNSSKSCDRLIATKFTDVKISPEEGSGDIIILMDLHIMSPQRTTYETERFTVTMLFGLAAQREGILFLGYSRLTPFSAYKQCADPAVDLQLCICETHSAYKNITTEYNDSELESVSWTKTYVTRVHKPCLYLKTRKYAEGVVLLISNACSHRKYSIMFNFLSKNLYSSNKMPVKQIVEPDTERLLVTGIRREDNLPWKYKYKLTFKAATLRNRKM